MIWPSSQGPMPDPVANQHDIPERFSNIEYFTSYIFIKTIIIFLNHED
jgi:hypothetical protein